MIVIFSESDRNAKASSFRPMKMKNDKKFFFIQRLLTLLCVVFSKMDFFTQFQIKILKKRTKESLSFSQLILFIESVNYTQKVRALL
jgi:hypothetical protein